MDLGRSPQSSFSKSSIRNPSPPSPRLVFLSPRKTRKFPISFCLQITPLSRTILAGPLEIPSFALSVSPSAFSPLALPPVFFLAVLLNYYDEPTSSIPGFTRRERNHIEIFKDFRHFQPISPHNLVAALFFTVSLPPERFSNLVAHCSALEKSHLSRTRENISF